MPKKNIATLTILVAILLDQIVKIYVKTHFAPYEEVEVFSWFKIRFVENNGMAMGLEFGGKMGKLFLTLFRLAVVPLIFYWLFDTIKKKISNVVVIAIALIFSGAIGNIIDSIFYGVMFNTPANGVATLFSAEPYGELFYGKVVDMFYFPIIKNGQFPNWIPIVGGDTFTFFNYIFNLADAYITVGVAILFIFSKQAFPKTPKKTAE